MLAQRWTRTKQRAVWKDNQSYLAPLVVVAAAAVVVAGLVVVLAEVDEVAEVASSQATSCEETSWEEEAYLQRWGERGGGGGGQREVWKREKGGEGEGDERTETGWGRERRERSGVSI